MLKIVFGLVRESFNKMSCMKYADLNPLPYDWDWELEKWRYNNQVLSMSFRSCRHVVLTLEPEHKLAQSWIIVWIIIEGCAVHFPGSPIKLSSTLVTAFNF